MPVSGIIKELTSIPAEGKSIADDLSGAGIKSKNDLYGKDPEHLYAQSNLSG